MPNQSLSETSRHSRAEASEHDSFAFIGLSAGMTALLARHTNSSQTTKTPTAELSQLPSLDLSRHSKLWPGTPPRSCSQASAGSSKDSSAMSHPEAQINQDALTLYSEHQNRHMLRHRMLTAESSSSQRSNGSNPNQKW